MNVVDCDRSGTQTSLIARAAMADLSDAAVQSGELRGVEP
jgi:hypothetical protein